MHRTFALMALVTLAACQNTADPGADGTARTQKASYAASVQYPRQLVASDELRAFVLLNTEDHSIRIANATDQPLRDIRVWVNGSYVNHLDSIPAHRTVRLSAADFYSSAGRSLAADKAAFSRVEIQTGQDRLYRLPAPVVE